jgi:hypothetical protein
MDEGRVRYSAVPDTAGYLLLDTYERKKELPEFLLTVLV